jgi:N-methylhydantoinase A
VSGIEVDSIGAGGGSIARVDAAGLITVGPDGAGANPGPMAYGLGGQEPTVTDAAVVCGLLDPDYFLGGEVRLDVELARKGVSAIAEKLGLGLYEAADGILAVARNNMTTATTEKLIGRGHDPRDFTIMAFGGGGGIFAAAIAKDMSISRVMVPPDPGVFCARGILTMSIVHSYARTYGRSMEKMDIKELAEIYAEMEKDASRTLKAEGMSGSRVDFVRSLDMAYRHQHYFIETPVPGGRLTERSRGVITDAFETLHENRYGHRIGGPVITANIRLKAIGKIKEIPTPPIAQGKKIPAPAIKQRRKVFMEGKFVDAGIYERGFLLAGNRVKGPAIIEEPFHTTVVMQGQTLEVDGLGNLVITIGGV